MQSNDEILNLIIYRFPDYKDTIYELFNESESFSSLCKDYFDCKITLDRLNNSQDKTKIILKEYQTLLAEIEEELSQRIIT